MLLTILWMMAQWTHPPLIRLNNLMLRGQKKKDRGSTILDISMQRVSTSINLMLLPVFFKYLLGVSHNSHTREDSSVVWTGKISCSTIVSSF
jgi:hypothetical protein